MQNTTKRLYPNIEMLLNAFVKIEHNNQPILPTHTPIPMQPVEMDLQEGCYFNSVYSLYTVDEKAYLECESLGLAAHTDLLDISKIGERETPTEFVNFLNSLLEKRIDEFDNLKQYIKDESIKNACPYSCRNSNIYKENANFQYINFVCKFHTDKKSQCKSRFCIKIENKVIRAIQFINKIHNHRIDKLFVGSKVPLLTSEQKANMRKQAQMGLPSPLIRRFNAPDLLPNQLYNTIRNFKNKNFENQIEKLYNFSQTLKKDYDVIWKNNTNNIFQSLLIINSFIKNCPYSQDIVMIDDTECTNNFQYPFVPFYVFDEHNKMQMLAVGIITSKEERSFCDIFRSLKLAVENVRVFIIDRLPSQISALNKVYPSSFLAYCRLHISRNIKSKMGRNSEVNMLFWKFVKKEITEEKFKNDLQNIINQTNSKHLTKLLSDIDHYNPYILKNLRVRGHYTTNAIEGSFGNLKKWTDHKILPLHEILKLFIGQAEILLKNHLNCNIVQLDSRTYKGRMLGLYAVEKIQKRIKKCKELIVQSLNTDPIISQNAVCKLKNCNCKHGDLPCIHQLYHRIINNSLSLINEEEIPDIYFLQNYDKPDPKINSTLIVENEQEENWEYNVTLDKLRYWADVAQRSEQAREHLRKFFAEGEKLKRTIDPNAKHVLKIPGAQPTVPSATVEKYTFKKKRTPCCSICHKKGHYSSTCPLKNHN